MKNRDCRQDDARHERDWSAEPHLLRAAFAHFRHGHGHDHRHHEGPPGGFGWSEGGPFGERMRRGRMKYAVLAVLAEGPRHGYEILTEIESKRGHRPSAGAIYPVLQMLDDAGLVTGAEVDGKRVYTITDAGRELLAEPGMQSDAADDVREPDARGRCRQAVVRLTASFAALRGASDAELEKAAELLDRTRREIHRLLAGEEGE